MRLEPELSQRAGIRFGESMSPSFWDRTFGPTKTAGRDGPAPPLLRPNEAPQDYALGIELGAMITFSEAQGPCP